MYKFNQLFLEGKYLALGSLKFDKGMNVQNCVNIVNCVVVGDGGNFFFCVMYLQESQIFRC
jgi:hypothetical protein